MAAPTPTARGTPGGLALRSGHATKITLAGKTTIEFWEKTVTPSGVDNGDKINTTTMFNTRRRTFAPRPLFEVTDGSASVAYDPAVRTAIESIVGVETTITWTFPDGTTIAEYGYLKSFIPQENSEENQPMADVTIVITSTDAANDWVETAAAVSGVSGT